jgi:hypothetical protein
MATLPARLLPALSASPMFLLGPTVFPHGMNGCGIAQFAQRSDGTCSSHDKYIGLLLFSTRTVLEWTLTSRSLCELKLRNYGVRILNPHSEPSERSLPLILVQSPTLSNQGSEPLSNHLTISVLPASSSAML